MLLLLSSTGGVNPAGPVANISLGAPAGSLVLVLTASVANISFGAPTGSIPSVVLRDPLHVQLIPSANRVSFVSPNHVLLHSNVQGETF